LGAGAADGKAAAFVQRPEVDAGRVRQPPHQAAQRVYFPRNVAFAHAPYGGVAAQLAYLVKVYGNQRGRNAHFGYNVRRLDTGVAAANHNNVHRLLQILV
jgi:hypothetical protein